MKLFIIIYIIIIEINYYYLVQYNMCQWSNGDAMVGIRRPS